MESFLTPDQLLRALHQRYATKTFSGAEISPQIKEGLFESLRLAPSSFGLQPWGFLAIKNPEIKQKLLPYSGNQPQITTCDELFVLCRRTDVNKAFIERYIAKTAAIQGVSPEKLSGYQEIILSSYQNLDQKMLQNWTEKQVYIALGFLLSACATLGVDSCPMEGFSQKSYDEILHLGEKNLASVVLCPVGIRSKEDPTQKRPKVRFDEKDILFEV